MKRLVLKLNIVYLLAFLGVSILLVFGFKALQERYLVEAAGNNMEALVSERATTINSLIDEDYSEFNSLITDISTHHTITKEISDELATRVDELDYSENIKTGYKTNEGLYLNDILYVYNEDYDYIYHENKSVIIYDLDEIISDNSDSTNYIYFSKGDVFIYFPTSIYLESIINASSIPENYYLLCETDGNVVYQENINSNKTSFIIDYVSGQNADSVKSTFLNAFDESNANNFLLTFDGVSSICIYIPVLSDLNSTLLLMYVINQDNAIASVNTLNILLIIVFASIFVIFFIMCGIFVMIIARKDKDVTAMSLGYLFSKPFIMKVSRKGKIKNYNSACYTFIYNMKQKKSILQFEFIDNSDDILDVIRKQEPFIIKTKNKSNKDMYIRMIPMKGVGYFKLVGDDYTESIIEKQRLSDIALYNSVTSLPNKYILTEKLDKLISSKEVFRSNYVLVAIDILHFVKINNLFGFSAADKMLEDVADILKNETKDMNVEIYNIRTSNFMLLFNKVSVPEDIIKWGRVTLKVLEKPIEIRERYLTSVETKMGIYIVNTKAGKELTSDYIYSCASTALQRAKESQLSKFMVYDSEFGNVLSRAQIMEQDLIVAIQKKQFVMFYQPQYDSKKKKIIGLEALIRWNNPKYLSENPETYIKMAEKNGAIVELGKLIIEESFKFAKTIEDTGIHVSINVSPAQLLHSGFVNEVLDFFKLYKLKKHAIAIEITETFLMENSEVVIAKIKILREAGFEIHLDDFGTGYSSILYLKDLPIDVIKIDKEFTNKFMIDKYSRVITTKIAQMAIGLDLKTIIEGVTTEKQMIAFSKIGCNVIQGYYISKPIDDIKIVELIKEINGEVGLRQKVKKTVSVKVEDTFTPEEINKTLEQEKSESDEINSKEKNDDISK